jgi:hypothetical protein
MLELDIILQDLDLLAERAQQITDANDLDSLVSDLLGGYVKAMEETVPLVEKSTFSKR